MKNNMYTDLVSFRIDFFFVESSLVRVVVDESFSVISITEIVFFFLLASDDDEDIVDNE
jgi:hypothetical protein